MYNFLFGGFDTLANCEEDDEFEGDELDSIPAGRKTKDGYLKDGFVVDTNDDEDNNDDTDDDDADDTDYEEEDDEEDTATETDDENYDDDDDDDDDDEDDDDEDEEDDEDEDDGDAANEESDEINPKKKCNGAKNKILSKKITASKKRIVKQPKEEMVPSFELVEEAYEYFDD